MNTEHVDIGLARYSDWAFTSSVVVLVAALMLLAVELAYSRGRRDERLREEQMVGAKVQFGAATAATSNASATVGADSATPGVVADAPKRPLDERVGKAGLALVYVGIGLLLACIVLRGLATARVPWGNMYEFINLTCFSGLIAAAIVLRRPQYRALWVFVLVPVLILLTVSGRWLYTNAAPVMPALQSYWLPIHVSVVSLGSGVFLVAGMASIMFLLKMSPLGEPQAEGALARIVARLPDAQTLDRIAYRTTIFAFPVAAREGALMAYGPDYLHMYDRAAFYVDRILKGTAPADLPAQAPVKFEIAVNLKTAKALGLDIPPTLLATADEVVE